MSKVYTVNQVNHGVWTNTIAGECYHCKAESKEGLHVVEAHSNKDYLMIMGPDVTLECPICGQTCCCVNREYIFNCYSN